MLFIPKPKHSTTLNPKPLNPRTLRPVLPGFVARLGFAVAMPPAGVRLRNPTPARKTSGFRGLGFRGLGFGV